jgi:hypothetical protein
VAKGFGMQVTNLAATFDNTSAPATPLVINMTSNLVVLFYTAPSGLALAAVHDTTSALPKVRLVSWNFRGV